MYLQGKCQHLVHFSNIPKFLSLFILLPFFRLDDTTNVEKLVEISFLVRCMKEVLHLWETVVATWSNKVEGWDVHIDHLRLLLKYTDIVSKICQSKVDSSIIIESGSMSECIVGACRSFLNSLQQKHVRRITGMCQHEWNNLV